MSIVNKLVAIPMLKIYKVLKFEELLSVQENQSQWKHGYVSTQSSGVSI